ncbi:MAG: ATP-grasp domain-containing protein [Thermomicrobiales bacterium]|nr:ATP-grasp domain-containing protein [Thermomicrobiales bacterium]
MTATTVLPLHIVSTRVLDGPNAWSDRPVARFMIDPGSIDPPSERTLIQALGGEETAPFSNADVDAGQLFAALVLEIQQSAGYEVSLGLSWNAGPAGWYEVVCEYQEKNLVHAAGDLAVRALNHLFLQIEPGFDFAGEFDRTHRAVTESLGIDEHSRAILRAARRCGIPVRHCEANRGLIELGTGIYQQRYMGRSSSKTRLIPHRIAYSKSLTNHVLGERGLPVPKGVVVSSAKRAVAVADDIGFPVVVKPLNLNHGRGVFTKLRNADEVRSAYTRSTAISGSRTVLVEQFIEGRDYRVFVADGKVKAIVERLKPSTTGDGVRTVRELLDAVNAEPRRQPGQPMKPVPLEETEAVLYQQGLTLDSVPEAGTTFFLHHLGGSGHGGSNAVRTEEIHPDNVRLIEFAVKTVGLDICGVDVLTPDIGVPLGEIGGVINEVNSGPEFGVHIRPLQGESRDVGQDYIDLLFPPGTPYRIPVVGVTGSAGVEATCERVAQVLRGAGHVVGLSHAADTVVDGVPLGPWVNRGQTQFGIVLSSPVVDCAVLGVGAVDVEERGLGFSAIDTVIVTRAEKQPTKNWRDAAQVLIDLAGETGTVILDAADPRADELRARAAGSVILVSVDENHPVLRAHLHARGRAVVMAGSDSERVVLMTGSESATPIVEHAAETDRESRLTLLFAVAAAVSRDIPPESIRQT